jgi:hypothetical protein
MADEHPQPSRAKLSPDGNFYWDDEAKDWKPVQRRDSTSVGRIVAGMLISVILTCLVAWFIISRL